VVEGVAGPCRPEHRHHARRQQERSQAPPGGPYGRGQGLRWCVVLLETVLRGSGNHSEAEIDLALVVTAENNLSFIETSALDANNVEVAFHNILKGAFQRCLTPAELLSDADVTVVFQFCDVEIYGIVSSKALEASNDVVRPAGGENITVSPTADDGGAKKSNCC
jgi:hypothetical protein